MVKGQAWDGLETQESRHTEFDSGLGVPMDFLMHGSVGSCIRGLLPKVGFKDQSLGEVTPHQ